MALFKIEKGLAADLSKNRPKVHDGWCYFTTDDGKFYIDIANDENAVLTNYPGGAGNRIPLNAFYADRVNFIPQIGAGHDKTTGELHLQIITGKKYDTATNTVVDNASGYLKLPAASKGKEGILSLDTQFIGGTKVLTDSPVFADGVKLATKNTLTGADFTLDKVSTCKYVMSLAQQTNVNTGNLFLYSSGNNNLYHNSSDNQILTQKTINDSMIPWGGNTKAGLSPIVAAASYLHSANRIQFANPAGITVEYSQNNGTTWTDYGLSNADKVKLVSGLGSSVVIGKRSSGVTIQDKARITMNATSMGVYTAAKKILFNITTNGAQGCTVLVEKSTIGKPTEFTTVGTYPVDGWSGWNAIPLGVAWGGSASQTSQVASFRFTFGITSLHTNTSYKNTLSVLDIMLIGDTYWTVPSNMAKTGHLYAWDESQNATFPAGIKTTTTLQVTGATTLSSVSINGDLTTSGNIAPTTTNLNLGSSAKPWANIYGTNFSGNAATATSANNGVFYVEGNTTGTKGTWTGTNTNIPSLYTGLTIAYKIGIEGLSSTEKKTTLALTTAAGASGNIAVYRNNSQITTHLGIGTVVLLVYDGTYWRWADYDNDTKVTQTVTASSTTAYPMIFKYSSATTTTTAGVRFASTITATPAGTITSVALNTESITASQSLKVTSVTDVTAGTATSGAVQISGGLTVAKHLQAYGRMYVSSRASSWVEGMKAENASIAITTKHSASSYHPYLYAQTTSGHIFNLGGYKDTVGIQGFYSGRTDNNYDWRTSWDISTGELTHTKDFKVSASTASTSKTTGAVVVTGGVGVGGSLYANAVGITTTLMAEGATTLKSSLSVTGITTLSDTLSVAGAATMCQITPKTDSSHDFGADKIRWANGFFDAIYTPEIKQNLKIVGDSSDVPLVIKSNASTAYLKFEGTGGRLGSYGFSSADVPVVYVSGTGDSKIVHEKNQATLKITVKGLLGSDDTTIQYNPLTAQTLEINPDEMFHKYTFNKSTTFSTAYTWYNTGVAGANMETGAYLISLSIGNDQYIGTMSWYAGSDVGSTDYDEIVLHKAGKATAGSCFYLRTKRTSTTLSLQISSNTKITTSTSYTITARKLL